LTLTFPYNSPFIDCHVMDYSELLTTFLTFTL
jgi:hypothetical protein